MTIDRFWGEHRYLSNFWMEPKRRGLSVEHFYQAAKASNNTDMVLVLSQETPGQAKKAGQSIDLRHDWESIKDEVMLHNLRSKFTLDPDLRSLLLATGKEQLVEGNTWGDTYWGVCNGVGQNNLGRMLMQVREELAFYDQYLLDSLS